MKSLKVSRGFMGLTQSAYARHRGCSHTAVAKALAAGRINRLPDGTIDPTEADQMWGANSRLKADTPQTAAARKAEGKPAPAPPSGQADYYEERAKHEAAKRALAELKLAETEGALVRRAAVSKVLFEAAREARNRLLAIPGRLAPLVAVCSDVAECGRLIADEVQQALEDLEPAEFRSP